MAEAKKPAVKKAAPKEKEVLNLRDRVEVTIKDKQGNPVKIMTHPKNVEVFEAKGILVK